MMFLINTQNSKSSSFTLLCFIAASSIIQVQTRGGVTIRSSLESRRTIQYETNLYPEGSPLMLTCSSKHYKTFWFLNGQKLNLNTTINEGKNEVHYRIEKLSHEHHDGLQPVCRISGSSRKIPIKIRVLKWPRLSVSYKVSEDGQSIDVTCEAEGMTPHLQLCWGHHQCTDPNETSAGVSSITLRVPARVDKPKVLVCSANFVKHSKVQSSLIPTAQHQFNTMARRSQIMVTVNNGSVDVFGGSNLKHDHSKQSHSILSGSPSEPIQYVNSGVLSGSSSEPIQFAGSDVASGSLPPVLEVLNQFAAHNMDSEDIRLSTTTKLHLKTSTSSFVNQVLTATNVPERSDNKRELEYFESPRLHLIKVLVITTAGLITAGAIIGLIVNFIMKNNHHKEENLLDVVTDRRTFPSEYGGKPPKERNSIDSNTENFYHYPKFEQKEAIYEDVEDVTSKDSYETIDDTLGSDHITLYSEFIPRHGDDGSNSCDRLINSYDVIDV